MRYTKFLPRTTVLALLITAGSVGQTCQASPSSADEICTPDTCGSYGKEEIDISGSNQEVFGGVHSNGHIKIGGSNNDFGPGDPAEDPFTYVTNVDNSGSGNQFDSGYPDQVGYIGTWPVDFDRNHYETLAQNSDPNHHYVNGDIDADYIIARGDGLYYATGKLKLDKTVNLSVTLVAEDEIDMSGSNQTLTPYMDDLLALGGVSYSGSDRCDKPGVKIAGSDNDWQGIIYAAESMVEISGSNNTTIEGSIVAWSVKLNGSGVTLSADGSGGGGSGHPTVSLLE